MIDVDEKHYLVCYTFNLDPGPLNARTWPDDVRYETWLLLAMLHSGRYCGTVSQEGSNFDQYIYP
jgi:hypothetical protein